MTCTVVRGPNVPFTPGERRRCPVLAPSRPHPGSLEQLRHPSVGERLPACLAGRAVLKRRVREGHLADRVPADRTGPAGPAADGAVALLPTLELRRCMPAGPVRAIAEDGPARLVQRLQVLARETAVGLERRQVC